ncbi:hypothetical protein ACOWKN_05905 [Helicobacter pylori]
MATKLQFEIKVLSLFWVLGGFVWRVGCFGDEVGRERESVFVCVILRKRRNVWIVD